MLFLVGNTIALADVPEDDSGVLGATMNTVQQISTALGASILVTVAASSESRYVHSHGPTSGIQALTHGDHVAFVVGAALTLAIGVAGAILVPRLRRGAVTAPALTGTPRPAVQAPTPSPPQRVAEPAPRSGLVRGVAWAITLWVACASAARGAVAGRDP